MSDFLVDHALANVWCAPRQDNQIIFKPIKLTPKGGAINRYRLNFDTITLPEKNKRYHLYNVGQVHPSIINLFSVSETWTSFTDVCNGKDILVNIYTEKGIELPRFDTFYYITKNKNIIISVFDNKRINFDFDLDDIYIRTYKNAYFSSSRSEDKPISIYTEGMIIKTENDIFSFNDKVSIYKNKTGYTSCYINGYGQLFIDLTNTKVGDYVELMYDSSVVNEGYYNLNYLSNFDSDLDRKGKYLIYNSSGNSYLDNTINYQDDVDLYLTHDSTGKRVFVNKNNKDTLRNITHKDYSLVINYLDNYYDHFKNDDGTINFDDLSILLISRESGWERPLVLEKNKINELVKLPGDLPSQAMVGTKATLDVWNAANLEKSEYIQLMSKEYNEINNDLVCKAYGYDSISKLTSDTPQEVSINGNDKFVDVPYLLQNESTAFEYDTNGYLIDWYHHEGPIYLCRNNTAKYVEILKGIADRTLDEVYGVNNQVLDDKYTYRHYLSNVENGVVTNIWYPANDEYNIVNKSIVWTTNKYTLTRSNKKFLCYKTTVSTDNGILQLPISYFQYRNNTTETLELQIPLGDLQVFLNGKILIEDLDYYFDTPRVVITNKSYIDHTKQNQDIVIRFTGHSDNDLKHNKKKDFGFIQRGRLSDNHRYNLKDGKVQCIVVNGSLKLKDKVKYYEDNDTSSTFNLENGKPYFIRDYFTPVKSLTNIDDYVFKQESDIINEKINDYVTSIVNQVSSPDLSVNTSKHYLYSPFLGRILKALITEEIPDEFISNRLSDETVRDFVSEYTNLLKYDPINDNITHYKDYVVIHPHLYNVVVNLDFNKYRFFKRVVELYANSRVSINNEIKLV